MDEIAVRCGFVSSSFFSTAFAKGCGMPPAEYRRLTEPQRRPAVFIRYGSFPAQRSAQLCRKGCQRKNVICNESGSTDTARPNGNAVLGDSL